MSPIEGWEKKSNVGRIHFANLASSLSKSRKQRASSIGTYISRQLASTAAGCYKIIFRRTETDGKPYETSADTIAGKTAQELSLVSPPVTSFFWEDAEIDFDVGKRWSRSKAKPAKCYSNHEDFSLRIRAENSGVRACLARGDSIAWPLRRKFLRQKPSHDPGCEPWSANLDAFYMYICTSCIPNRDALFSAGMKPPKKRMLDSRANFMAMLTFSILIYLNALLDLDSTCNLVDIKFR